MLYRIFTLLILLLAAPAWGADCPNPITASDCGCRAVSAGATYTLSANMTCDSGTAIELGANNITLDGQGFSIDGDNTGSTGVTQYIGGVGAYSGITIQNVTVKNFINNNIKLSDGNNFSLSNVTSTGATDGAGGDNWPYAGNGLLVQINGTYSGLTISGGNYSNNVDGIHVIGHNAADKYTTVSISNLTTSNNSAAGIYVQKASGVTLSNINADNNGSTSAVGEDYGIAFTSVDSGTVSNCTITNTNQNDSFYSYSDATANYGSANDLVFEKNYVSGSTRSCIGLGSNGEGTATGNIFRHNILTGCTRYGIYFYNDGTGTPAQVSVTNNTIVNNTLGGIWVESANFPVLAKNNIFSSNGAPDVDFALSSSGLTSSNNLWYRASGNVLAYNSATYTTANIATFEATAVASDPLLTATYGLQSNSPAKDAGAVLYTYAAHPGDFIGAKVYGSAPDIGAYEYQDHTFGGWFFEMFIPTIFNLCASTNANCYTQP